MRKRLYRNTKNEMIAGVCSGIAEYLNIDPTIVRVLWVLFAAGAGSGVLAYIICTLLIPEKPDNSDNIIDME